MTIMSIIITEEDLCKKHAKKCAKFCQFSSLPSKCFQAANDPTKTLKMTLNPILVLIIITHARGFETIKKYGGQGYLAAP